MTVLDLFGETDWFIVDCVDPEGNAWHHKVSDPEETVRTVTAALPDVICTVRPARKSKR